MGSLAEAAAARGVQPGDIIKTLVVRRADDDFLFVLVPGDREISWPKLRALLGVNRISMPDAATAREVTGYERGHHHAVRLAPAPGRSSPTRRSPGAPISLGAGEHGLAVTVAGSDVVRALDARLADITDPLG